MTRRAYTQRASGGGSSSRLIIGIVLAVIALISYFSSQQYNPVTGENQYISITPDQEIALGLQSVPSMFQEFGNEVRDPQIAALVENVGQSLVRGSIANQTEWEWDFHAIDNDQVINAFALPGGQVFITTALLNEFNSEDQLAGVLAHEIVHVLARHSAQQIAKSDLTNGLVGAIAVASENASAAQTAAMIGQLVNMSYGRDAEIQSDTFGVCLMASAGYDPEAMIEVMQILASAGGGSGQPEFFSTHPNPDNRIARIQETIQNIDTACAVQ